MPANLNLNLPQVPMRPISPVLGPQPFEGLISGIERGRSLGLRERQMALLEEEAKRKQVQFEAEQQQKAIENVKVKSDLYKAKWFRGMSREDKNAFHRGFIKDLGKAGIAGIDSSSEYHDNDSETSQMLGELFKDSNLSAEDRKLAAASILAEAQKRGSDTEYLNELRKTAEFGAGAGTKPFYFVDPTTREMFDTNLNPIATAPAGAAPKMLTNPNMGSEMQKRSGLVEGAQSSVATAKSLLTPAVLNEVKGIKFTPGKIYQQMASPEAKKFYRNLYNAIANELYIKSGATATPNEIEGRMLMYMPAANDEISDMQDRLDMLSEETGRFKGGNSAAPLTGLKAGVVVRGYRFKGGDPANKSNWVKQ